MRVLVTEIRVWQDNLAVRVSVRNRLAEHEVWVKVPWKWLAVEEVWERLTTERTRLHRSTDDPVRPYLPLESWE